ncbi:hypothetical protein ACFSCX_09185 [Bacillus salitolerans]|uniref:Uncharacterized protein n=1 Tax=Bacillus salitolerans TaxID=1437434 RepID=A0ABW4LNI7_9BACI
MQQHHEHSNQQHQQKTNVLVGDVEVLISSHQDSLNIKVCEKTGLNPKLLRSHEKIMHLIIVSKDLEEFHHLHPAQLTENEFSVDVSLSNKEYVAFVDIKPEGMNYSIKPIPIVIEGRENPDIPSQSKLKKDINTTRELNGKIVELHSSPLVVGEDITFRFDLKNATPMPYLGALGHVVIIDEKIQQFIHVHPLNEDKPIFVAHFKKAGLYKMWAEFILDNELLAFPFVVQVTNILMKQGIH